ncbi:MAG: hypothetical protein FWC28_04235 [Proteobacteria bacterium]|nr:hypothetical protein [Cystobacterineae bacterium]MCL2259199.1 hypothetical protein [Cystobacterineae bacterium]MCL2314446.1 hypothetical protein [Pseudomonadota bacterium]
MKYHVRTPDGSLTYSSVLELREAYLLGLVEPMDEVLREGDTAWRKAALVPELAQAQKAPRSFWADKHMRWALGLALLGTLAGFSFLRGSTSTGILLVLAFVVIGLQWLTRWQRKKYRKP